MGSFFVERIANVISRDLIGDQYSSLTGLMLEIPPAWRSAVGATEGPSTGRGAALMTKNHKINDRGI
jgi:hypothetical protein